MSDAVVADGADPLRTGSVPVDPTVSDTPAEFGDTLRMLAEGEIDPSPLLTGVVGIDGVPEAFTVLGHPETHAKVVVEPGAGAAITAI